MDKTKQEFKNVLIYAIIILISNSINGQQMKDSIINDSSFKIKENPLDSYQGKYKNGKPYEGYFKKGDREFYTVDFYEKGIPVYQYSMDILEQMEQEEFTLDIKSTYKEGTIYNGSEVIFIKNGILTKQLKNGILESFTQDIFAVHYYNRLTFKKEKDTIIVTNLQEKGYQINLFMQNTAWIAQLLHRGQIVLQQESVTHTATHYPKNSMVRLYIEDSVQRGIAYQLNDETNDMLISEAKLSERILNHLDMPKTEDLDTAFEHVLEKLIKTQGFSTERNYESKPVIIGYFYTNEKGAIKEGIHCVENENNTKYQIYKESKLIKEENTTVATFQEVFSNYIKNQN